jgi:hypothetical protein
VVSEVGGERDRCPSINERLVECILLSLLKTRNNVTDRHIELVVGMALQTRLALNETLVFNSAQQIVEDRPLLQLPSRLTSQREERKFYLRVPLSNSVDLQRDESMVGEVGET